MGCTPPDGLPVSHACKLSIMFKLLVMAMASLALLTPAMVPLLPDWAGIIYDSPAGISQAFQA